VVFCRSGISTAVVGSEMFNFRACGAFDKKEVGGVKQGSALRNSATYLSENGCAPSSKETMQSTARFIHTVKHFQKVANTSHMSWHDAI
jgi:hypothetical protein